MEECVKIIKEQSEKLMNEYGVQNLSVYKVLNQETGEINTTVNLVI